MKFRWSASGAALALLAGERMVWQLNCDPKEGKPYFQDAFNVPRGFKDYQEMFREVRPDIISIGTYCGLHRPIATHPSKPGNVQAASGFCAKKPIARVSSGLPIQWRA